MRGIRWNNGGEVDPDRIRWNNGEEVDPDRIRWNNEEVDRIRWSNEEENGPDRIRWNNGEENGPDRVRSVLGPLRDGRNPEAEAEAEVEAEAEAEAEAVLIHIKATHTHVHTHHLEVEVEVAVEAIRGLHPDRGVFLDTGLEMADFQEMGTINSPPIQYMGLDRLEIRMIHVSRLTEVVWIEEACCLVSV